jgi:hypothetical protein
MTSEAGSAGNRPPLLDRRLPHWHFREIHRRRVAASPREALEIALALRVGDLPLGAALMAVRMAPGALTSRRRVPDRSRPLFESFLGLGFVELARGDEEIALGAVGKFWRLNERPEPLADAAAFERFGEPGFAKGAIDLRATPAPAGCELVTETRVWATDERARRAFRPYWVPVRAAGGLMRRELLRAVARRAAQR